MGENQERAARFHALHRAGDPLVLFNIWDAGSAKAVAAAGATAIATGSWSVAAAAGFADGEALPRALALDNLARIAAAVDLPVTVDLEGGYGEDPALVAETADLAMTAGAVGCNFEDGIVGGSGIHPIDRQSERIAAIREAAERRGAGLFINARTDVFLAGDAADHRRHIEEALKRAHAYREAGASGLFVPGLTEEALIARLCEESPMPVNVMASPSAAPRQRLAALGVARISHGPGPYRRAMEWLQRAAEEAMTG